MTQKEFLTQYNYNPKTDRIGGGSFGEVYKAYDTINDIEVAIKVAKVVKHGDKVFSLKDEFGAVSHLKGHKNIANFYKVYSYALPTGQYDFAVMQYYKDGNLSDLIKENNLSFEEKEQIVLQILDGLSFLHKHRVVHRDMKPSNVLLHKRNIYGKEEIIPKIADFGLSKVAKGDKSCFTNSFGGGTLAYSSPEQLKNAELKFNTDLWAWAIICFELFTGKKLFNVANDSKSGSAEQENKIYQKIVSEDEITLQGVPDNWKKVLSECLLRDPNKRIQSAEEIQRLLANNVHDEKTEVLNTTATSERTKIQKNKEQSPQEKPEYKTEVTTKLKKSLGGFVKNKILVGVSLVVLFSGILLILFKGNSEISKDRAKEIYKTFHQCHKNDDVDKMEKLFSKDVKVLHNYTNTTFNEAKKSIEDYQKKWNVKKAVIEDFYKVDKNRYHYNLLFTIQNRKSLKIYVYNVSGQIAYLKEDGEWKVNYIKDKITKKVKEY